MTSVPQLSSGLPMAFYNMPHDAKAIFSTQLGTRAKRALAYPYPSRVVRSDLVRDILLKGASLREQFPVNIYDVTMPTSWYALYHYFDAYDIYVEGPEFCMQVLYYIAADNDRLVPQLLAEIESYAAEWVACNEDIVLSNPPTLDFSHIFPASELEGLRVNERIILKSALDRQRAFLFSRRAFEQQQRFHTASSTYPQTQRAIQHPHYGVQAPHAVPTQGPATVQVLGPQVPYYTVQQQRNPNQPSPNHSRSGSGSQGNQQRPQGVSNQSSRPRYQKPSRRHSNEAFGRTPRQKSQRRYNSNPCTPPRQQLFQGPVYVLNNNQRTPPGRTSPKRTPSGRTPPGSTTPGRTPSGRASWRMQNNVASPFTGQTNCQNRFQQVPVMNPLTAPGGQIFTHGGPPGYAPALQHFQHQAPVIPHAPSHARQTTPPRVPAPVQSTEPQHNINRERYPSHNQRLSATDFPDFYGNRKVFENDPNARFNVSGSCTYTYVEGGKVNHDPDRLQTVHVSGIDLLLFESHRLKDVMGQCGPIGRITILPRLKYDGTAQAFVQYMESDSVNEAIRRLNGYDLGNGQKLTVSVPAKSRSRTYSNRTIQARQQPENERSRISQPTVYRKHLYSEPSSQTQSPVLAPPPDSLNIQFEAVEHQLAQHRAALNRMASFGVSELNIQKSFMNEGGTARQNMPVSNKKENMPLAANTNTSPLKDAAMQGPTGPGHQGGKNKKKGPKKNNPNRRTPNTTPTKPQSERSLGNAFNTSSYPSQYLGQIFEEAVKPKENTKPPRKPHLGTNKRRLANNSQPTQSDLVSPTDTTSTETTACMTASETSNASIASTSFVSVSDIATLSDYSTICIDHKSVLTLPHTETDTSHAQGPAEPGHTDKEGENNNPLKSVIPKPQGKKGHEPVVNAEIDKSRKPYVPKAEVEGAEIECRDGDKKDCRSASSSSGGSQGKDCATTGTSTKAKMICGETASNTSLETSPNSVSQPMPKSNEITIDLNDESEFPSLGPPRSPPSEIVNGKRPAPPTASCQPVLVTSPMKQRSHISSKHQTKPIVAVPRNFNSVPKAKEGAGDQNFRLSDGLGEAQGDNGMGSRSWPFVKRFREK